MMMATRAFLIRDLRIAWSYRLSFCFQSVSLLFSVFSLKFVSDLLGQSQPASLTKYGGDYFSFALVGVGITMLAFPITRSFAGGVRANQVTGTFEAMLTTRTSGVSVVMNAGLYPVLLSIADLSAVLLIGGIALGASFNIAHVAVVFVVVAMTMAVLLGIGLLSAAFAIVFKQNEPFTAAFMAGSLLVSGIMYPTSVLPGWLGSIAPFFPLTHSAELIRLLLLHGATISQLGTHFGALGAFCLLLPVGLFALNYSINWARRTGSLSQY